VRKQNITTSANALPDPRNGRGVYPLRRLKKNSSSVHVCGSNERIHSITKLITSRTVLTVITIFDQQDAFFLKLGD